MIHGAVPRDPAGGSGNRLPVVVATGADAWHFLCRHGFLGQSGECIDAADVSADARRTTAGARKPSRSINHCWL